MQYNILVADDNPIECDMVVHILKQLPQTGSIIICEDGIQIMRALQDHQIDVVFTDIEMPGLDGHILLKSLRNPPPFVFVTSYADYAAESFNMDVIDYVVKPVTFARLAKAAIKAFEYIAFKAAVRNNSLMGVNEFAIVDHTAGDHFFIRETEGITRLRYKDVLYIESMGDFSKIFKVDGQKHIILSGLKSLESQLPKKLFIRVHKQYIVNMDHIQTISRGEILLSETSRIPLSAIFRQELMAVFMNKEPIKRN
jgi:two-component system LytT family response regulator